VDTALIIFTAGTAASFLPLYWMASRLTARSRRAVPIRAAGEPAGRREFFDLLRREAASRAVTVLHEALVEARLTADHEIDADGALSLETRKSLDETRRLVDSLFAGELREIFRHGVETLSAASSSTIGTASATITNAIIAFERALEGHAERPRAAPRRATWSGLLHRARGWIGAGDDRVTA